MEGFSAHSIRRGQFTCIAGPCSIEGEDQFLQTALAVKKAGAHLLRGGIWKMRTSADSFQGLGSEAFGIIQSVLQKSQMGLVSEVTDPRQIEFLDQFVSVFQVGARNMFNYALLKELGQLRKPVLLKRSFSALVDEWLKAADYISRGGNSQIVLCERGIRTFESSSRFTFDLNSVLIAKERSPYPVIVDPSHAIGLREHVPALALASVAAGADGIIVEVHPDPDKALSDSRQAMSLQQFNSMMGQIQKLRQALFPAPVKTASQEAHA